MAESGTQIRLIPQSEAALDNLAEIGNLSDLVNRAIQVYSLVMCAQADGLEICWCGVEITPDMPEHTLCHPGME